MADSEIKNVEPNIKAVDLGDGTYALSVKDTNSDAVLVAWQTGG